MTVPDLLRRRAPRDRAAGDRDESGVGMVELLVTLLLASVLLATTVPIYDTFFTLTSYVSKTYSNSDQIIPVETSLQQLIRSAIQPAPITGPNANPALLPTSPFGLYTTAYSPSCTVTTTAPCPVPNGTASSLATNGSLTDAGDSLSFFSNVGNANGPALITACLEVSITSGCATGTPLSTWTTFEVTESLPTAGTCPTTEVSTATCKYSGTPKPLLFVTGITNYATGIFQYTVTNTTTSTPYGGGASTTTTSTVTNPNFDYCEANPPTTDANPNVTSPLAKCAGAEISAVTIDLRADINGSGHARQAEDSSTVYLLSATSSDFSPEVG